MQEYNAKNYEYNGKELTEYEATQTQRYIERQIRKYKREIAGLDAAGLDSTQSKELLKKWQERQRDFIDQTGLKRDWQRERVQGYSRKKTVENSKKSGIINMYKGKGVKINSNTEISSKTIKQVKKAIKKVTSDFKILEQYSEPISFAEVENGLAQNHYDPNTGLNKIILRRSDFADSQKLLERLKQDYISGKSYETDTIQSLVAHEMGHNAHIALALKRANLPYGIPLTYEQYETFRLAHLNVRNDVYEYVFAGKENATDILNIMTEELGSNSIFENELISQSFGNYYYGKKKSKVAEKVVEFFKKELK